MCYSSLGSAKERLICIRKHFIINLLNYTIYGPTSWNQITFDWDHGHGSCWVHSWGIQNTSHIDFQDADQKQVIILKRHKRKILSSKMILCSEFYNCVYFLQQVCVHKCHTTTMFHIQSHSSLLYHIMNLALSLYALLLLLQGAF